jgi:hypothetical protein
MKTHSDRWAFGFGVKRATISRSRKKKLDEETKKEDEVDMNSFKDEDELGVGYIHFARTLIFD